jgi:hypothetical protein
MNHVRNIISVGTASCATAPPIAASHAANAAMMIRIIPLQKAFPLAYILCVGPGRKLRGWLEMN